MSFVSMTGFGACNCSVSGLRVQVEMKSLNHRHCDVSIRMPKVFHPLEPQMLRKIRQELHRGRVEVNVMLMEENLASPLLLNVAVAEKYYQSLCALGKHFQLFKEGEKPSLELLASFRDIFEEIPVKLSPEELWQQFEPGFEKALLALKAMRAQEGLAIKVILLDSVRLLRTFHAKMLQESVGVAERLQKKIAEKMREILTPLHVALDEGRLVQETAYWAERSDIREELDRLQTHLKHLENDLNGKSPIGRRLDFLIQEMNREINTIGSKCTEMEITQTVVNFKAELERVREQIQNVE